MVVVFGLRRVNVFADGEAGRIVEDGKRSRGNLNDGQKLTLVGDFLAGKGVCAEVEPCVAIRIGDGLDELMGEIAVSGIDQLAVGRARANLAAGDVLERLDGVEDVADVGEGDAVVISAEDEAAWFIGRVANGCRRGEALILTGRKKDVEDVLVTALTTGQDGGVNDGAHGGICQRRGWRRIGKREIIAERITIACVCSDVLISDACEVTEAKIVQEGFGIAPASGDGARAMRQQENRMRLREGNDSATEIA